MKKRKTKKGKKIKTEEKRKKGKEKARRKLEDKKRTCWSHIGYPYPITGDKLSI